MHPFVIRSAIFCTVSSLFVFVSDIIGDQIVLPYSSVALVMAVYVPSRVSLDFPQCVVVRASLQKLVSMNDSFSLNRTTKKCISALHTSK